MIAIAIFNELSGRYLENWKTGDYLIFPSQVIAMGYINKMNLNPKHYKVRRIVKNEVEG